MIRGQDTPESASFVVAAFVVLAVWFLLGSGVISFMRAWRAAVIARRACRQPLSKGGKL
jgi:hypothetical protein